MKKTATAMNDSMHAGGYSQEEAYFHKDNQEKIRVLRASRRGSKGASAPEGDRPPEGGKVIPFPLQQPPKTKKAA